MTTMSFGRQLGKQIKNLREAMEFTQEELAHRCGVGKAQISKIERDASIASGRLLLRIAKVLNIELGFVEPLTQKLAARLFQVGLSACFKDERDASPHIRADMQDATEIKLLLFRGWRILGRQDSLLRNILEAKAPGTRIRILLLNPASQYVRLGEDMLGLFPGAIRDGIDAALKVIDEIQQRTAAELDYGLYDEFPLFRLLFADEVVYVASYSARHRVVISRSVHYRIEKKQPPHESLFLTLNDYFEHLWGQKAILP